MSAAPGAERDPPSRACAGTALLAWSRSLWFHRLFLTWFSIARAANWGGGEYGAWEEAIHSGSYKEQGQCLPFPTGACSCSWGSCLALKALDADHPQPVFLTPSICIYYWSKTSFLQALPKTYTYMKLVPVFSSGLCSCCSFILVNSFLSPVSIQILPTLQGLV